MGSAAEVTAGPREFTLRGKRYVLAEAMTVERHVFVARRLRKSGIVTAGKGIADRPTLGAEFEDVVWDAFASGIMYEILGGLIVPEGVPWSEDLALATAQIIRQVDAPDEMTPIFNLAADTVFDFLEAAARSSRSSQRSSSIDGSRGDSQAANDSPSSSKSPTTRSEASPTTSSGTSSFES